MSQKTLPGLKAKSPLRRRVRRDYQAGDQIGFKTKSFTQEGIEYGPTIDVRTFEFHCSCKDHECRKRVCKHLKRAALQLIKSGELPAIFLQRAGLKCCHQCGATESLFPMCHDNGSRMDGVFICALCVQTMNTKAPTPQEIAANSAIEPFADESEPVGFKPDVYEETRKYLQFRVNQGEYVHECDWRTYQLVAPSEMQGAI